MDAARQSWLWPLLAVCIFSSHAFATLVNSQASSPNDGASKSATFRSPPFTLAPGEVHNTFFYAVDFVEGHVGLKAFDAEVVDEDGNSVPLSDVYLHHWIIFNYLNTSSADGQNASLTVLGNDGPCPDGNLRQLYGLGSETRHTSTRLPGPYAIEVGKYEGEAWLLNVHAIDTRGTLDPFGCLECRCDLYNVTVQANGEPLEDGYKGGLSCCYDKTRCLLKDGYVGANRTYYLQYTVHYWDWNATILPVKIYILDATYDNTQCKVEYDVPSCASEKNGTSDCLHIQESVMKIPVGGDVVYGVAHQHKGAVGGVVYGQDGREICSSTPLYGNGTDAGNEAGYIVGMTTCYPEPGTVRVLDGENLTMLSNYSATTTHTGVMGLGYIAIHPH